MHGVNMKKRDHFGAVDVARRTVLNFVRNEIAYITVG
jgi:hypothetical protein